MNKILALLIILGAMVAEPVMAACNNLLDYDHRRLASQVEDNLCEAYGDTFPMFATSPVKGSDANALFAALAESNPAPSWNFTKYLIGRDGEVLAHFGSRTVPLDSPLEEQVIAALED